METVLGIFCKQPVPGNVKTRLAADVGDTAAAQLYEAFLVDIVERMRDTPMERILCYAPPASDARAYFEQLGGNDYRLVPQPSGDLGDRLASFFAEALLGHPRKVIVIGSDSPTMTEARIRQAADELDKRDAVLGMSSDGGYYLIGLRRWAEGLFTGIDWSTSSVYDQQTRNLQDAGFDVRMLTPIPEVDTLGDVELLKTHPMLSSCARTKTTLKDLALL